jgi:hypothetical protein
MKPTSKAWKNLKMNCLSCLVYYNWERPHQGINGKKPVEMVMLTTNKIPGSIVELLNPYNCER